MAFLQLKKQHHSNKPLKIRLDQSPKDVVGEKNTVILADTSGFHRRHPLSKGKIRKTGRLVLNRPNPFELNV